MQKMLFGVCAMLFLAGGVTIGMQYGSGATAQDGNASLSFDVNWALPPNAGEGDPCDWQSAYTSVGPISVRGVNQSVSIADAEGRIIETIPLSGVATATQHGNYCQLQVDTNVQSSPGFTIRVGDQYVVTLPGNGTDSSGDERPSITID